MAPVLNPPRDRFFLYPEPIAVNDERQPRPDKSTPVLRGPVLVVAALLLEWFGFLRRIVWADAGFSSLRPIRTLIEDTEPRFDPTVFPCEGTAEHNSIQQQPDAENYVAETPVPSFDLSRRYSVADYRALYLSGDLTPLNVALSILPLIRRDTQPPGEHSVAWFEVKKDLVIKAAEASTLRYKQKKSLGPLDGVPTAVKDEYDVEGYSTSLGSVNDYTDHVQIPSEDGTIDSWCVKKLSDAGAIILGKLSMHEFGMDTSGNNITHGTPRNPYNPDYYPGGSSSGSAYAVSVGLVPITLGSDGGGSIRLPASFNSVFGLKPTHGRLSCLPGQNHSNTNGVNGPIAADMRSLATLYEVISQPHPATYFPPNSLGTGRFAEAKRPKVIGIPEAWFNKSSPGVQTLCQNMISRLATQKGYAVVPIKIPFVDEGQMAHALTILTDASTLLPETRGVSPANRILLALGRTTPATDYLLAQKLRRVLMQHLAWLWQTYPGMVIVTPTSSCAGWPIRSSSELMYGVSDGGQTLKTMKYVWLANFCGAPSISVPAGFVKPEGAADQGGIANASTVGKVAVGLMATGEWASEHSLLQFGLDAEEAGADLQCLPPNWVDVVKLARK